MKPTQCLTLLLMFFLIYSCEQIIEPVNIKNKSIKLHAPQENATVSSEKVTFSWENDSNIEQYRIQVVSPHFDSPYALLIDSLVWESRFSDTLVAQQDYAWRVRGENSLYRTEFSSRKFTIGLHSIAEHTPVLLTPGNNTSLDHNTVNFVWNPIQEAENYHLQLASPSFEDGVLFFWSKTWWCQFKSKLWICR